MTALSGVQSTIDPVQTDLFKRNPYMNVETTLTLQLSVSADSRVGGGQARPELVRSDRLCLLWLEDTCECSEECSLADQEQ